MVYDRPGPYRGVPVIGMAHDAIFGASIVLGVALTIPSLGVFTFIAFATGVVAGVVTRAIFRHWTSHKK